MRFDRDQLEKMVCDSNHPEMNLTDLPDLELYVEQLTSLLESKLGSCRRGEDDKVITKTMINNYTKAGLLMPSHNKKYSKEHMILLLLIYNLKSILSISDIRSLFGPILNDISSRDDDIMSLADIYAAYLELNQTNFDSFYNSFLNKIDLINHKTAALPVENKDQAQLFLFVLMLVAQANTQKRLAERIIDDFFKPREKRENGDE
ncbi:MAG: DUF1836 domain-containing protein [Candidatus Saccharibacteria bacterium]